MNIGEAVSGYCDNGQFRFYILPFLTEGVTIRVEVSIGEVWCYVSTTDQNPHNESYTWKFFISDYNDFTFSPGAANAESLFLAIEGLDSTNNFILNSTTGNTAITGKHHRLI